jgi:hypothetical protein
MNKDVFFAGDKSEQRLTILKLSLSTLYHQ